MKKNVPFLGDFLLILVTVFWGTTFALVKTATASCGVYGFLGLRFTIATVAMALLSLGGRHLFNIEYLRAGIRLGVLLFASFALQTVGLQYTSATNAGFITGVNVVWVLVFSAILFKQRPDHLTILGVLLACAGLYLLVSGGRLIVPATGDLWVLGCSLAVALHVLLTGKYAPRMHAGVLTTVQLGTVSVLSWLFFAFVEGGGGVFTGEVAGIAVYTALGATVFAFWCQTWAQKTVTPARTAVIFILEPVFCALFSFISLGEQISGLAWCGAAFIIGGILLAELRAAESA